MPDPLEQVVVQLTDGEKAALYDWGRRNNIATLDAIFGAWVKERKAEYDSRKAFEDKFRDIFAKMTLAQLQEAFSKLK